MLVLYASNNANNGALECLPQTEVFVCLAKGLDRLDLMDIRCEVGKRHHLFDFIDKIIKQLSTQCISEELSKQQWVILTNSLLTVRVKCYQNPG